MITISQTYLKIQTPYDLPILENEQSRDKFPESGLFVFHGKNSSGKSMILRSIGGYLSDYNKVLYIPTERIGLNVSSSTVAVPIDTLANEFQSYIRSGIVLPEDWLKYSQRLATALFSQNEVAQKNDFQNKIKDLFNFDMKSAGTKWVNGNKIELSADGSGIKAAHFVIAALSTDEFNTIIIDEPELCLEPRVQKRLFELLVEKSKNIRVFIATHSPHFINRNEPTSNFIVQIERSTPSFEVPKDMKELYDMIIVDKLGFSTSDIFLPEKIIIVEGESDRIILNAVLQAKCISNVFIHKIGGIDNYDNLNIRIKAIEESISPHLRGEEFYLYAGKVALLTDYLDPSEPSQAKLRKDLEENFAGFWYQVTEESETGRDILYALPDEIYALAELDKTDVLTKLEKMKAEHKPWSDLLKFKTNTASTISSAISAGNVHSMMAVAGVEKVINFINSTD